ncbi:hypothetical protein HK405_003797 [Cladochytrium tenue]|nr:hypothetical protein HK405_003797 [Cladochytrium tenue]
MGQHLAAARSPSDAATEFVAAHTNTAASASPASLGQPFASGQVADTATSPSRRLANMQRIRAGGFPHQQAPAQQPQQAHLPPAAPQHIPQQFQQNQLGLQSQQQTTVVVIPCAATPQRNILSPKSGTGDNPAASLLGFDPIPASILPLEEVAPWTSLTRHIGSAANQAVADILVDKEPTAQRQNAGIATTGGLAITGLNKFGVKFVEKPVDVATLATTAGVALAAESPDPTAREASGTATSQSQAATTAAVARGGPRAPPIATTTAPATNTGESVVANGSATTGPSATLLLTEVERQAGAAPTVCRRATETGGFMPSRPTAVPTGRFAAALAKAPTAAGIAVAAAHAPVAPAADAAAVGMAPAPAAAPNAARRAPAQTATAGAAGGSPSVQSRKAKRAAAAASTKAANKVQDGPKPTGSRVAPTSTTRVAPTRTTTAAANSRSVEAGSRTPSDALPPRPVQAAGAPASPAVIAERAARAAAAARKLARRSGTTRARATGATPTVVTTSGAGTMRAGATAAAVNPASPPTNADPPTVNKRVSTDAVAAGVGLEFAGADPVQEGAVGGGYKITLRLLFDAVRRPTGLPIEEMTRHLVRTVGDEAQRLMAAAAAGAEASVRAGVEVVSTELSRGLSSLAASGAAWEAAAAAAARDGAAGGYGCSFGGREGNMAVSQATPEKFWWTAQELRNLAWRAQTAPGEKLCEILSHLATWGARPVAVASAPALGTGQGSATSSTVSAGYSSYARVGAGWAGATAAAKVPGGAHEGHTVQDVTSATGTTALQRLSAGVGGDGAAISLQATLAQMGVPTSAASAYAAKMQQGTVLAVASAKAPEVPIAMPVPSTSAAHAIVVGNEKLAMAAAKTTAAGKWGKKIAAPPTATVSKPAGSSYLWVQQTQQVQQQIETQTPMQAQTTAQPELNPQIPVRSPKQPQTHKQQQPKYQQQDLQHQQPTVDTKRKAEADRRAQILALMTRIDSPPPSGDAGADSGGSGGPAKSTTADGATKLTTPGGGDDAAAAAAAGPSRADRLLRALDKHWAVAPASGGPSLAEVDAMKLSGPDLWAGRDAAGVCFFCEFDFFYSRRATREARRRRRRRMRVAAAVESVGG